MLHTQRRTLAAGWRQALLAACAAALLVAAWGWLEAGRLRGGHADLAETFGGGAAGAALAFICGAAAPSLPYLSAALIPSALAVMAPCLLQMSIVLVTAVTAVAVGPAPTPAQLRRQGLAFAAGFLGVYGVAALALGLAGEVLAPLAPLFKSLGGALILVLGLAVLRVLPRQALSGCRGPRWLILTGKATLRRPLQAGVAFGVYCVGCCGPYLSGLALLGAGSGSFLAGAALVVAFALLMGGLLLLPIFALPLSRRVGEGLSRYAAPVSGAAGSILVAIGTALVLEPLVAWAVL